MSKKPYCPYSSSHVLIDGFDGVFPIMFKTGDRVWTTLDFGVQLPAGFVHVSDGMTNGYDADGWRMVSVPDSECSFIGEDEAVSIDECRTADRKLMALMH